MSRSGQALLLSTFSLVLLCRAHQWPDQFPLQPETLGFNARYVTVSPGTQLYVVDRPGITSLPPVVLIHGLADAWRSWQLVMAQLGSDRRIIAYDVRGHGASSKPSGDYSFRTFALDLKAVLEAMGVEQVGLLVGHSLGSIQAWHFAGMFPDAVERLILADTIDNPCPEPGRAECVSRCFAYMATLRQMRNVSYSFAVQSTELALNISRPDPDFFDTCNWDTMQMTGQSWASAQAASCSMAASDPATLLPRIKAKTVIIRGAGDKIFTLQNNMAVLHQLQSCCQARLVEVKNEGHSVQWSGPGAQAVVKLMLQLLQQNATCKNK